jgi:threonine/homoserine/homoserine lactone efflux protein
VTEFAAFLVLAGVVVVIPGPATTLVSKNAVVRGFGSALVTAGGVLVADLVWMLASVAGVTAILVASEPAFAAIRIAGAVYLTWLGLRLLLGRGEVFRDPPGPAARRPAPARRAFGEGVLCDLSNPKTLIVFTSVIPQFAPADAGAGGLVAYGVTFALLGLVSLVIYAAVFAQVRRAAAHVRVRRALLRCAGVALIAFGLRVATEPAP